MSPPHTPLTCPRCFYDLSGDPGATSAPDDSRGRCAECGLGFVWMHVRYPHRAVKPWSFEHQRGGWRSFKAFFGTAGRVAVPWVFWDHFSIETPIVLKRAALWALLVLAVPFVLGHVIYISTFLIADAILGTYVSATLWSARVDDVTDVLFSPLVYPLQDTISPASPRGVFLVGQEQWVFGPANCYLGVWAFVLAIGLHPVLLASLPEACQRARVRSSHILRAVCYSFLTLSIYPVAHLALAFLCVPWEWLLTGVWSPTSDFSSLRAARSDLSTLLTIARPLAVVWLSIWWTFAVKSWRLTNPREVYAVIWIVGILGAMIVLVVGEIY